VVDPVTANVIVLLYYQGTIYQKTSSGAWYQLTTTSWPAGSTGWTYLASGDPRTTSCAGVSVTPASGINNAINAYPTGTTFCLAAGTYNEAVSPKTGDILWGAGIGQTIIDSGNTKTIGIEGFTNVAQNVTVKFLTVRNYTQYGIRANAAMPTVDGWLVDTVEVASIGSSSSGTGFGIWLGGNMTVQNSLIHDNWMDAFRTVEAMSPAGDGTTITIKNNDIYNNLLSSETPFCCSFDKGDKMTPAYNVTMQNNKCHDQSSCIWFDSWSAIVTIDSNEFYNCTNKSPATRSGAGAFFEITYPQSSTTSRINNFTNNYVHDCVRYGVVYSNAGNGNITGNAFANIGTTSDGFALYLGDIHGNDVNCPTGSGTCTFRNVTVSGNFIAAGSSNGPAITGVDGHGASGSGWKANNNSYDNNTYYLPSSSTQFVRDFNAGVSDNFYTPAQWQALGFDAHSTFNYNGGILPSRVGPRGGFVCKPNMGSASGGLGVCP
jgi:hypothetical protein